jgi:osmotically inducible protein OsmC
MASFARRAVSVWTGDVTRGTGQVTGGTEAFTTAVTFPRVAGEPPGATTPEEMLAASLSSCYAIGLRSVIRQRGGAAERVTVTATVTAEKDTGRIRIVSSHLEAVVDGLTGIDAEQLADAARAADEGCTVSNAIRRSVALSFNVAASAALTKSSTKGGSTSST